MKNIIKNTLLAAVILSTVSAGFVGCKKGEDDPFLSLRTRKARVAGEWKITSIKSTDVSGTATDIMTMNGSTYTETDASGTSTGTWTLEYTFEKDGTYKSTENMDGVLSTSEGTWNFTSGVGKSKNKSQITLYETTITSPGSSSTYTGNYVDIAFDLKELRNKKMVWYYKSAYTNSTGSSGSYEIESVFEPK